MAERIKHSDPCFFRVDTDDDFYNVSFEITYRCNLECKHCFNRSNGDAFAGLSRDDVLTLVDELAKANVKNVYMTGGEPTQYPYFLDVVEAINNHNIELILATNGYDIRRYINALKYNVSHNAGVYVSIDGLKDAHNSLRGRSDAFFQAIESIKLIRSVGLPVRISSLIWDGNYSQLDELILLLKKLGVSQINLTIPVQVGRAETNDIALHRPYSEAVDMVRGLQQKYCLEGFKIFLKRDEPLDAGSFNCQAGLKIMHINSNGEIYPCSWISKAKLSQYSRKWRPGELEKCIDAIRSFGEVIRTRTMKYGTSGCPAMAQIYNGDMLGFDPLNELLDNRLCQSAISTSK